ncbi:uncharacterized protein LOC135818303 [Sycon ciliatum]|uniref:uncharacterized protein LOC135818303 n=1 Tax=Sycon ciliatum TaxID=27933 RepID=UPI0031F5FD82
MAVPGSAYTGFGSFHSDNIQDLIAQSDSDYRPPTIPPDICMPEFPSYDAMMTSLLEPLEELGSGGCFGKALLDRGVFLLDRKWTFLNHGAFGATCLPALRAAEVWRRHTERQPLLSFDRVLLPHLVRIVRLVSRVIGARSCADVVLVPNATQGLWACIQTAARVLHPDDAILTLDIGYGSVKKMVKEVTKRFPVKHVEVTVPLPPVGDASSADIALQIHTTLEQALKSHGHVKLVLVDAITSNTAICLPVKRITELCHRHGAAVIVDAAHALGQIPLNVSDWGADIVVGNFHKWWCAARGAAFVYSNGDLDLDHFRVPRPEALVISHGYGHGMLSEFSWDGNRDYSAWLALDASDRFWSSLGVDRAREYCVGLLRDAATLLVKDWSTRTLVPLDMCHMMALVEVPVRDEHSTDDNQKLTSDNAKFLQDKLHYQYSIEVPVKCVDSRLWVRISAAVYNTIEDYQRLSAVIREIFPMSV